MREREVGIDTVYAKPYDQLHSVDFGTTVVQSVYDVKNADFVCLTCRISARKEQYRRFVATTLKPDPSPTAPEST